MSNNPVVILVMIAISVLIARFWWQDYRAQATGQPRPGALPGARPTSWRAVAIACAGVLVILAAETWGEQRLGLAGQQSRMTILFALYTLCAPIIEELVFRGYLVVENRGRSVMWLAAFGASLLFAALHPFLWQWDDDGFAFTLGAKGWFSAAAVFVTSLWLYAARLAAWNRTRSLLPCVAAHFAKNAGVFAIKAFAGYIAGWW